MSSNANSLGLLWKKLWATNVPTKVKICAWKIARDIIPTKMNLRKKRANSDLLCLFCGAPEESTPEALVAREGALLGTQRGFQNFILESDSLKIVAALNDPSTNLSIIGHIIEDSKALLASVTGAISTNVRRQANCCAHRLACYALLSNSNCIWNEILSGSDS
ncbi:hypothetical protein D8674_026636 [Pyrus ussuriensis x Pyrus communis]|uniref:RNase H type-1 domain-containing protein n=1 Tax=Pyrus ussuriensis x Pyrus communis TaxID=2448454 RepID=A0A5N5IC60_9ROSA|nr:hypothetical protein D8674_026636 [Pyrus ussuriensis x Pyrus communis]